MDELRRYRLIYGNRFKSAFDVVHVWAEHRAEAVQLGRVQLHWRHLAAYAPEAWELVGLGEVPR